jgi:hypothetical protein
MAAPSPNFRPPFTSSGLNTLLKEASGIRRLGDGAAEMAESLGTLLMAKAAAEAGDKARAARRTTLFKEDVETGFNDVLQGVFAEPPKPTPETLFATIQTLQVDEVKVLGRLLSEWAVESKASRKEAAKQRAESV